MIPLLSLDADNAWPVLLILVQVTWCGMAVLILAAAGNWCLRHSSVQRRYLWNLLGLVALVVLVPLAIIAHSPMKPAESQRHGDFTLLPVATSIAADFPVPPVQSRVSPAPSGAGNIVPITVSSGVGAATPLSTRPSEDFFTAARNYSPWIVMLYFIGVAAMLVRLAIGISGGQRLQRQSRRVIEPDLLELLRRRGAELQLRILPKVAICERIAMPVVIGILRPVILLPGSMLTGLTIAELADVLTHELAHLKRYDHLVLLLQRSMESILFFHPAAWYLSRKISRLREQCCDDVVVAIGGDELRYAQSLLRVAELHLQSRKSQELAALALDGQRPSELRMRISRLLHCSVAPTIRVRPLPWMALLLTIAVGIWQAPRLIAQATPASDLKPRPPVEVSESQAKTESPAATPLTAESEMMLGRYLMKQDLDSDEKPVQINMDVSRILEMLAGRSLLLEFPKRIHAVDQFDEKKITVRAISPTRIRVEAANGFTGMTKLVVGTEDQKFIQLHVWVQPDLSELSFLLKKLYPDSSVELTPVRNKLLIRGTAKDNEDHQRIIQIAETYYETIDQIDDRTQGVAGGPSRRTPSSAPVAATDPKFPQPDRKLTLAPGRSQAVNSTSAVRRLFWPARDVIDVVQFSPRELAIRALKVGKTELIVWFEGSDQPMIMEITVKADAPQRQPFFPSPPPDDDGFQPTPLNLVPPNPGPQPEDKTTIPTPSDGPPTQRTFPKNTEKNVPGAPLPHRSTIPSAIPPSHLTSSRQLLIPNQGNVVACFVAAWCEPCRKMQGLLDRVAQEDPTVQIVDIDWNRDLAQEHHIEQIPTFCVFEDGKEVRRRTGRMSEKEFLRFIEKNEDPRQADSNGPEDVSIPLPAEVTSRTFIRDANLINPGGVARTDSVMMEAAGNGPHLRIEGAPHESSSQSPHVFAVLCLGGLGGIHHGLGIPQPASACLCRRSEAETRDRPFWGSDRAAGGACRRNAA